MTLPTHIGRSRSQSIVVTPGDDDLAALSLTLRTGVPGVRNVGDRQPARGAFVPVGGAYAASNNPQVNWGGADGSAADVMLAEYDAKTGSVYPLRTIAQREPRNFPWFVGKNISILGNASRSSKGIVIRGSMMGDAGFDQHVYIAGQGNGDAPLVLHHDQKGAPAESNIVYEGGGARPTIWSDALRIGAGVDELCAGHSGVPNAKTPDWVYLNATKHGGNRFSGFLASRFKAADAFLSYEVGGMVRPASSLHDYAFTRDKRWLRRAALSIANTLWTNGNPKFDAPMWIEEVDEEEIPDEPAGHLVRVHCQFDPADTHVHPCKPGTKPKKIKWNVREPISEGPPCDGANPKKTAPPSGISYGVTTLFMSGYGSLSHPKA